jgi:prepilin-type N-terminal cleavage/methylation domain-containing protein
MKRGFTLVELLVVVAIMSILTILTVSQFQTAKKKANDVARKGDLNALSKALEAYYADYGKFPIANGSGMVVLDTGVSKVVIWGGEFKDNAVTPYVYMKTMPNEKILKNFQYCYVSDGASKFGLFAMLENTTDSQCIMNGNVGMYSHCGGIKYCFAYVSPNISVNDLSGLVP